MAAMGITWNSVGVPGDSIDRAIEALERYGAEVIKRSPAARMSSDDVRG
jgi:hypothetical protein